MLDNLMRPCVQLFGVRVFKRELVLGTADAVFDGEILHRLHVEFDAFEFIEPQLHPLDHCRSINASHVVRLQIDEHAASVERRVDAIDADKRRHAFDCGVLKHCLRQGLLTLRHAGERYRLRRLRNALNDAGVLQRKKALRHKNIE